MRLARAGIAYWAVVFALGVAMMGMTPAQWLAEFRQPHAPLGLAGQGAFALMPWWRVMRSAPNADPTT